ncbi:MAG: DNA mismatch repair protein MutS, partial [Clostridiales bacterium]|nr:DNA mismatch repair protein MutS [Clostridiales bacterium]
VPMCGVPYHAAEGYIAKLIEKGYKVAICEQMTPPSKGKELVKREVVRVITPGTLVDSSMLKEDMNNFLVAVSMIDGDVGFAWTDISTGEFNHLAINGGLSIKLNEMLARINPSEIICNEDMLAASVNLSIVKYGAVCPFSLYNETAFDYDNASRIIVEKFGKENYKEINKSRACVSAVGALLTYINETQKRNLINIKSSESEENVRAMSIDSSARRTLELVESASTGKKKGSLLWVIDKTLTKMGARKLRSWLEMPSLDEKEINDRLDAVSELYAKLDARVAAAELLENIGDIERICGRLSYGNVSPRDCLSLGQSLVCLPKIKELLSSLSAPAFAELSDLMADLSGLGHLILSAINSKPSNLVRDGGVIKEGFNDKLDEYRNYAENAKDIIQKLEIAEREATGIKNLRIHSNKVFGQYIEVPKSQIALVPYRYIRKQTTVNSERYITEELKEIETKLDSASEMAISLELQIYEELVESIKGHFEELMSSAKAIAVLDCLLSNALVARENGYVRPIINSAVKQIKITEGRHPVVEKLLKGEAFVPNDTFVDSESNIMLITGPNMAGKSVYMKQVALITILAHCGSFVPASYAEISLVDRLFTRVGASDDLGSGRSTFMVEMSEVAFILDNITDNSLILLDEIGRGTSTYDGLSIAWSIIEFISQGYNAKTLFSTHYHELTELEGIIKGVKNYKLSLKEINGNIVFLRKLMRGSANRSFGIEVAGLAGLPDYVLGRAKELLKTLEKKDIVHKDSRVADGQMSLFNNINNNAEINAILNELDIDNISPRHALDVLADLKEKAGKN